jgi:hypothetical protein
MGAKLDELPIPVAIVNIFGSNIMSSGGKLQISVKIL